MIRDWGGRFIARKSMNFIGSIEASRVETMAAKEGLQLAVDFWIRVLILESDAQMMMESFGSNSNNLSHGLILIEAYRLVLGLNYYKAQYTPRCCNRVADRLAKSVKDWDIRVWTMETLSYIKDILASEA